MNISIIQAAGVTPAQRLTGSASEAPVSLSASDEPEADSVAAAMSRDQLDSVVAGMQSTMQSIRRDINFQVDDSSGRVVVKVVDSASGEVVRQIPSEEAVELAVRLEDMRSLLFREEA